jgi:hypothetical protein
MLIDRRTDFQMLHHSDPTSFHLINGKNSSWTLRDNDWYFTHVMFGNSSILRRSEARLESSSSYEHADKAALAEPTQASQLLLLPAVAIVARVTSVIFTRSRSLN